MKWIIEEKYDGMLIRDYLKRVLLFSNAVLRSIKFNGGKILINDVQQYAWYKLKTGDIIRVILPREERGFYMTPENIPLSIIYEDDHLLLLDKQAGIVVAPTPHTPSGTIANGLLAYYDQHNLPYTAHIVTRLDRNTSGIMIVAKHQYMHSLLAKTQQETGQIHREYRAILQGKLGHIKGVIDKPIGRKEGSIIERTVSQTGKRAITNYEVLEEGNDYSLVKISLKTGRTHQIRVHFSAIGHPVIGDDLYGHKSNKANRHLLHCYKVQFTHPITKDIIKQVSPLPYDMRAFL